MIFPKFPSLSDLFNNLLITFSSGSINICDLLTIQYAAGEMMKSSAANIKTCLLYLRPCFLSAKFKIVQLKMRMSSNPYIISYTRSPLMPYPNNHNHSAQKKKLFQ